MGKNRLEAFSDGVLAIIITIMVLELKVPHGDTLDTLLELAPVFFSYVLSFLYVGIYWNNHHHLLHTVNKVSGGIMWANMHLLFWLSLIPFSTGWMGENHFGSLPVFVYALKLLLAGIAYYILQLSIIRTLGKDCELAKALGNDIQGKLSPIAYVLALVLAFYLPFLAISITAFVALVWLVPDRRIEKMLR
jgi:uncharacterized membrane protein